MSHTAYIS